MKKLFALSMLCSLFALSAPVKPASLFDFGSANLQKVCDEGYDSASQGEQGVFGITKYIYDLTPTAGFQTVAGGVYSVCRSAGNELKSKPSLASVPTAFLLMLSGNTSGESLSEVKDWAAALSFTDAAGKEIFRLMPTVEFEGRASDWKIDCSGGSCHWRGRNSYIFETKKINAAAQAKIKTAAKLKVLINTGNGIQNYILDDTLLSQR